MLSTPVIPVSITNLSAHQKLKWGKILSLGIWLFSSCWRIPFATISPLENFQFSWNLPLLLDVKLNHHFGKVKLTVVISYDPIIHSHIYSPKGTFWNIYSSTIKLQTGKLSNCPLTQILITISWNIPSVECHTVIYAWCISIRIWMNLLEIELSKEARPIFPE